jgi:von Willebrand factor type D domain
MVLNHSFSIAKRPQLKKQPFAMFRMDLFLCLLLCFSLGPASAATLRTKPSLNQATPDEYNVVTSPKGGSKNDLASDLAGKLVFPAENRSLKPKKGSDKEKKTKKAKAVKSCAAKISSDDSLLQGLIDFTGFDLAYSIEPGLLQLSWLAATFVTSSGVVLECKDFMYHVFVGDDSYDFSAESLQDLQTNALLTEYTTDDLSIAIDTQSPGSLFGVLVVASLEDGTTSVNRDPVLLRSSTVSPTLRAGVVLKSIDDMEVTASRTGANVMLFGGASSGLFENSDWIYGTESITKEPFLVQLKSLMSIDDGVHIWEISDGSLSDVYERLNVDIKLDFTQDMIDSLASDTILVRRNLLEGRLERKYKTYEEETFGPFILSYDAETKFTLDFFLDIDFDHLSLSKLDTRISIVASSSQTAKITFKEKELIDFDESREIGRGGTIVRFFFLGGSIVPVVFSVTPVRNAFVKGSLAVESEVVAMVSVDSRIEAGALYSLDNGFQALPPAASNDVTGQITSSGKATITVDAGFRYVFETKVYFVVSVNPFIEIGPSVKVTAELNPTDADLRDPPFHFSEIDLGGKVTVGVTLVDDDGKNEEDQEPLSHDVMFNIITLPEVTFSHSSFLQCDDVNAFSFVIEVVETPPTEWYTVENKLSTPFEFVPATLIDNDQGVYDLSPIGEGAKKYLVRLQRSKIVEIPYFRYPEGNIYFRSTVTFPPTPFYSILASSALSDLGLPELSSEFDCCGDSDCDLKYAASDTEYKCEDYKCRSNEPTGAPTPLPTPFPTPPPIEESPTDQSNIPDSLPPGNSAGANGDPHLFTFDGGQYSCQASGDFILSKSLDSQMEIQARFKKKSISVSLATAVVIRSGITDAPLIELSISETPDREVNLFVNRELIGFGENAIFDSDYVSVEQNHGTWRVFYHGNGLLVTVDILLPSFFPHFNLNVRLPTAFRNERIVGLLGSPTDNRSDDWMDRAGNVLTYPTVSNDLVGEVAYTYCTDNWCLTEQSDSLFQYDETFTFEFFSGCEDPYGGDVDLSLASDEIIELCGLDVACIIDGIELGLEGSQNLLTAESQIQAGRESRFRFTPSNIQVGRPFNIRISINLTDLQSSGSDEIEAYNVYRVNSLNSEIISPILVVLNNLGNNLFSNVLALESTTVGETFDYTAVPVIASIEDHASPFRFTSNNAVISYSVASGIGLNSDATSGTIEVGSVIGLFLVVEYSWPLDQTDLDTGTFFLGSGVGYRCGSSSPYLLFSGDNTEVGGIETVRVALGDSFESGDWVSTVSVNLRAGWFVSESSGPASLTVYAEQIDGARSEEVSLVIIPAETMAGCASKDVGLINVVVLEDGSILVHVTVFEV